MGLSENSRTKSSSKTLQGLEKIRKSLVFEQLKDQYFPQKDSFRSEY